MQSIIKWTKASEALPTNKNETLFLTITNNRYIRNLEYSHKHKLFNVVDDFTEYAIKIDYWAEIPKLIPVKKLDKDVVEFIYLLKNRDNTIYNDEDLDERIRHFVKDKYVLDEVSDSRIILELKFAFLEMLDVVSSAGNLFDLFLTYKATKGIKKAYIYSLQLLPVMRNGKYINGFWDINQPE